MVEADGPAPEGSGAAESRALHSGTGERGVGGERGPLRGMLAEALGGEGRIEEFRRDGWAKPWPVGVEMLCYMVAHEAHHRGQVYMLAHQLGFPLPMEVMSGIWNWEKLWKVG